MFDEEKLKLLGRIAFGPEPEKEVRRIVISNKGTKEKAYVNGYNACDGSRTLTKIAEIVGVTLGTLSPILKHWEERGILYKIGKNYKKLFPI